MVIILGKIVYAQTVLEQETLDKLKEKSGEIATKDALMAAVNHYLDCPGAKG